VGNVREARRIEPCLIIFDVPPYADSFAPRSHFVWINVVYG
jgi:hypothetical protein